MARRRFQYKPRTAEQTKTRAEQSGGAFDSFIFDKFTTWTPKEGDHRVRIMPPTWENPEHFGLDAWAHFSIGSDNNSYLCTDKQGTGVACPICQERTRAEREGESQEYIDSLKPIRRVLAWIVVRGKDEAEGPKIWPMAWTLDREITQQSLDKETNEIINLDDPDEGFDLLFKREGSSVRTRYTGIQIARRSTPLTHENGLYDEWMDFIVDNPLPSTLHFYDPDHIKKVFAPSHTNESSDGSGNEPESRPESRSDKYENEPEPTPDPPQEEPVGRVRVNQPEPPAPEPAKNPDEPDDGDDLPW